MKPKVSVVIPIYNHGKYITEAINSVLNQSFQDFEIIITNDGSTDNTAREISKFNDSRIKILTFEKNRGISNAMNNCITNSTGKYIAHLNADDSFLPDKLQKQVDFLEKNNNIGAVFTRVNIIDENGKNFTDKNHFYYKIFEQTNKNRFEWLNHFFYKGNCLCHPSVLIRRECFDGVGYYDARFQQIQDFEFWTRLCINYEIYILPEKLTNFKVFSDESNSSGNRPENKVRCGWESTKIFENFLRLRGCDLEKVFPKSNDLREPIDDDLVPYHLAMIAINAGTTVYDHFALETLFKLLHDKEMIEKINRIYGFDTQEFIRLTSQRDIFGATSVAELQQIIRQKDQIINLMKSSKFWKLREKYMGLKNKLKKDEIKGLIQKNY